MKFTKQSHNHFFFSWSFECLNLQLFLNVWERHDKTEASNFLPEIEGECLKYNLSARIQNFLSRSSLYNVIIASFHYWMSGVHPAECIDCGIYSMTLREQFRLPSIIPPGSGVEGKYQITSRHCRGHIS